MSILDELREQNRRSAEESAAKASQDAAIVKELLDAIYEASVGEPPKIIASLVCDYMEDDPVASDEARKLMAASGVIFGADSAVVLVLPLIERRLLAGTKWPKGPLILRTLLKIKDSRIAERKVEGARMYCVSIPLEAFMEGGKDVYPA